MKQKLTLIQITDTHLLENQEEFLRGQNPWHNLQMVLSQVKLHQPHGLLLTGDLADRGSQIAYESLLTAISEFDCPVYWLCGNHDDASVLQKMLPSPDYLGFQVINLGIWCLILLDSVLPEAKFGEGYLQRDQLQWLKKELSQHQDQPTIIALHHHPIPTGIDWVDQMGVTNGADLVNLLSSLHQAPLVVFGHIHHELQYQVVNSFGGEINFLACPSTFSQVTPPQLTADCHLPGFRLLHLHEDGSYTTAIKRVASFAGTEKS